MKEKTSITLSREVLERIDRLAGSSRLRSAFIERVLRRYFLKGCYAGIFWKVSGQPCKVRDLVGLEAWRKAESYFNEKHASRQQRDR